MKTIEFIPNVGMSDIPFGITREEVKKIMLESYGADDLYIKAPETDCYFDCSLQFSFEPDDTLSFIEAASSLPVQLRLLHINTWEMDGEELLEQLKEIDSINTELSEGGANPIFQNKIIALYDLDEQYDYTGGHTMKKWAAIGIGDDRYYQSIVEIYKKI